MIQKIDDSLPRISDLRSPIGVLNDYFTARRIATAIDSRGEQILIRPDAVLIRATTEDVAARVGESAERNQWSVSTLGGRYVKVSAKSAPTKIAGERRFSVETVAAMLQTFEDLDVSPIHVYLSSTFSGSPFVSSGGFAGNPFVSSGTLSGNPFVPSGHYDGHPFVSSAFAPFNSALPAQRPASLRSPLKIEGARQPQVLVLDTGMAMQDERVQHADLRNAVVAHSPWRSDGDPDATDDDDEVDVDANVRRELQSGHGTFVSGVVGQLCPDANVHIDGVLSSYGIGDDESAGEGLYRALTRTDHAIDIVVMSFGGYTENDNPPPIAGWIDDALAERRRLSEKSAKNGDGVVPGLLLVAAAGNNNSPRPMFPAALNNVVSIGALDSSGRAYFSNYGGWVDACAPGVDVVSTYFGDFTEVIEPPEPLRMLHRHDSDGVESLDVQPIEYEFDGWAKWSGTSFSAPKVAGAIAQEMYLCGVDAPEAWKRLSHWEKFRYPDLGVVFNIR